MLRRECDSRRLFSSAETSDSDCEMAARCGEAGGRCLCKAGPCAPGSEAFPTPTPDALLCEHCGKNRGMVTRYSEGYGTEEECALSDPRGESDADADIEDTDCRLQEPGSPQRISSRRRKRPRVARQDTTESEDDGGRSHGPRRWNLRLSPAGAHSRTIPEESVSQVRPLVVRPPNIERQESGAEAPRGPRGLTSLPVILVLCLLVLLVCLSFYR